MTRSQRRAHFVLWLLLGPLAALLLFTAMRAGPDDQGSPSPLKERTP